MRRCINRIGYKFGAFLLVMTLGFPAFALEVKINSPQGDLRQSFVVELADTPQEQQTGLMNRDQLDAQSGMLFAFSPPQKVLMWMRNTLIPLDMLFFDANKRLTYIAANAIPHDETPLGPNTSDTAYVLEILGGQAAKNNIGVGDSLAFDAQAR